MVCGRSSQRRESRSQVVSPISDHGHMGWSRVDELEGETLMTTGHFWMARLEGRLWRSSSGGMEVGRVAVRLTFEHRLGPPGTPLLLDADGLPFADEGDTLICAGGFPPAATGQEKVFCVGKVTRTSAGPAFAGSDRAQGRGSD